MPTDKQLSKEAIEWLTPKETDSIKKLCIIIRLSTHDRRSAACVLNFYINQDDQRRCFISTRRPGTKAYQPMIETALAQWAQVGTLDSVIQALRSDRHGLQFARIAIDFVSYEVK